MNKKEFGFEDDIRVVGEKPSELGKVTEVLLNGQFGRRKTNLDKRMISAITTLDTVGQIYDIDFIKTWIPSFCEYLTSIDGQGRGDIVQIATAQLNAEKSRYEDVIGLMGKK